MWCHHVWLQSGPPDLQLDVESLWAGSFLLSENLSPDILMMFRRSRNIDTADHPDHLYMIMYQSPRPDCLFVCLIWTDGERCSGSCRFSGSNKLWFQLFSSLSYELSDVCMNLHSCCYTPWSPQVLTSTQYLCVCLLEGPVFPRQPLGFISLCAAAVMLLTDVWSYDGGHKLHCSDWPPHILVLHCPLQAVGLLHLHFVSD